MTHETITVCDGCGKEKYGKDRFETFYDGVHPNNSHILKKKHYCDDCEAPDDLRKEKPRL